MAVIKTGNTLELIETLYDQITTAIYTPYEVKYSVDSAVRQLSDYDKGVVVPGVSTTLSQSASAITLTDKLKDAEERSPIGSQKISGTNTTSFTGNGLDTESESITGLKVSSNTSSKLEGPALSSSGTDVDALSATIRFNRNNPDDLTVGNFTSSETEKHATSGFVFGNGYPYAQNVSGTYSAKTDFKGSASFVGSDLASSTIKSLNSSQSSTSTSEGFAGRMPVNGSYSYMESLSLTSQNGLTYSANPNSAALTGTINNLIYSAKATGDDDGEKNTSENFFQSTDLGNAVGVISGNLNQNLAGDQNAANNMIEALLQELLKGNDTISATNTDESNIRGGAGNDRITGNIGDDSLYGDAGDDMINAGKGRDELYGDTGNDKLYGGDGADGLEGGEGNDLLDGGTGHDYLNGDEGDDTLFGGTGNDSLSGDAGHDTLDGGEGNDNLHGGEGNDTLIGGSGNDLLAGYDGNDNLNGGAGYDVLSGGAGQDSLTGGAGRDAFVFTAGDSDVDADGKSLDSISDFKVTEDSIVFSRLSGDLAEGSVVRLASSNGSGNTATYASLLTAANALFDNEADPQVVIGYDKADTYVFVDSDGINGIDMAIKLVGVKGDAAINAIKLVGNDSYFGS